MSIVSVRSAIVAEIKNRLIAAGFYVSRKLHKLADLRDDQLPAVSILNGIQRDKAGSMDDDTLATWDLSLVVYVKDMITETPQETIDEAMALVARSLLLDGTLNTNAYAINSYSRDTDKGIYFPFASAEMVFRIQFFYSNLIGG